MYRVAVASRFEARHALWGGDYGPELQAHTHAYRVELALEGAALGADGFLVDITVVRRVLAAQLERFAGRLLNELPAFAGLNPSLEHFARILAQGVSAALRREAGGRSVPVLTVTLWEAADAWASYRLDPGP